jgi:hypothetical protein
MPIFNKIPVTWQSSIEEFESLKTKEIVDYIDAFAEQFNKEFHLNNVEIHLSQPTKEAGFDSGNIILKLHMHLTNGKTFLATAEAPHIDTALKKAINEIHHQSQLSDRQKHNRLGRHRSHDLVTL